MATAGPMRRVGIASPAARLVKHTGDSPHDHGV